MGHTVDELAFPRTWQILETVGPVFSAGGLKNWDMCLARNAIVFWPRGIWLTIRAGIIAGIHGGLSAVGVHVPGNIWSGTRPEEVNGERTLVDVGNKTWRRYLVGNLDEIRVKKVLIGYNEIRLTTMGHRPDVYGICDHAHTDFCRRVLHQLYGRLYAEEGFPITRD